MGAIWYDTFGMTNNWNANEKDSEIIFHANMLTLDMITLVQCENHYCYSYHGAIHNFLTQPKKIIVMNEPMV